MLTWLIVLLGAGGVAHAQLSRVSAPERLMVGQRANLFMTWEGQTAADGVVVQLPPDWALLDVRLLRYGWEDVPVTIQHDPGSGSQVRYVVEAPQPLQSPHELVVRVQASDAERTVEWQVVPFSYQQERLVEQPADAVRRVVRLRSPGMSDGNQVLAFSAGRGDPLVLESRALPELEARTAYTIAFWLRTTGLDEVVLSTWSGDESEAYPLEVVIESSGRLAAYRGRPGHHEAVTTQRPLADGSWHHVAIVHQPDGQGKPGRWRLYVDANPVDSLGAAEALSTSARGLALGGRLARTQAEGGDKSFTGMVDDLTLLPAVLPPAVLRRYRYEPVAPEDDGLLLQFEEAIPASHVGRPSGRAARRAAVRPSDDGSLALRAHLQEEGVELSWQVPAAPDVAIVVEQSGDGQTYREMARLSRADAEYEADGELHFEYIDMDVSGRVVFYRVRQIGPDDELKRSSTLKVGLGGERREEVLLIGNFPNPFSNTTTISYELPETEHVRVAVWDLSGHQVATLVNEVQTPGTHEAHFSADDLPSGTYFVRLQTPTRRDAHKMLLMK